MGVYNVKSQSDLSGFYIVFKGSVQNEKKGWFGISHAMEHLVCKHFKHLYDDFDIDGITWNAYTSDNEIVFHFTGLDDYTKKYRKDFLESLLTFNFTEEEFQNERNIVLEEYKDSFNSQGGCHGLNLSRKLFNYYSPIGLKEDLEKITYQDCKDFFELQFTKPHFIINVSKYSEFKTDIKFSDKKFDNVLKYGDYNAPLEPSNEYKGKTSIIDVSPVVLDEFPYVKMICSMLGAGLKSPLYQEIREKKGLVYFVQCYLDNSTPNSGVVAIGSETSNKNVKEFQDTVKMVLENPKKYMTKERFNTVKKAFEIQLKKNEILRYNNVGKYIDPKEWQIEPIIKTVTLEKLLDVYEKYFDFSKYYLSIDKEEFKK